MVFAERQLVSPVASELVSLVKTGEAAIRGDIERILRNDRSATSDRGSVIDGFGIGISPRDRDSVRHALAQANRSRVKNRIARGGFVDKRLHAGNDNGPLDI